jgi:hypothetical protein
VKNVLSACACALVVAVASSQPAQSAPWMTFNVPVDVTDVMAHGYAAAELGLFVECSVSPVDKPAVETGAGYVKHVPVASSGITVVKIDAKPTIYHDAGTARYTCTVRVGWINENPYFGTTGGPASDIVTGSLMQTKPVVLKFVAGPKPNLPRSLPTPSHPTGPVTSPPKNQPPR